MRGVGLPADRATRRTLLLSSGLAVAALAATLTAPDVAVLRTGLPLWAIGIGLAVVFSVAEHFLLHIEFRRQAHSFTLAGVPLVLGVLLVPIPILIVARLAGSLVALCAQRISSTKIIYNCAAYCFEAAATTTIARLVVGQVAGLRLSEMLIVVGVIAAVDQLMSLLVLWVIRQHGGRLSPVEIQGVLAQAGVLSLLASSLGISGVLLAQRGPLGWVVLGVLVVFLTAVYASYAAAMRRHEALELVHQFVADGVGLDSLVSLAASLLTRIRSLLRAGRAELWVFDDAESRTDAVLLQVGEDDEVAISDTGLAADDWVALRALAHNEATLVARNSRDRSLRRWLAERGYTDAIVVPVSSTTGVAGLLIVSDRLGETATFTRNDLTLLKTLTGHLAVAADSARMIERLAWDASHDPLTALHNRAHLSHALSASAEQSAEVPSAVLLLDLDGFKDVNDALGHHVGDQLLIVVAERLRAGLPVDAVIARLGGDEFAVLLTGQAVVDEIEQQAAQLVATLAVPALIEGATISPQASVGVAVRAAGQAHVDLLRQADTAMYVAKGSDQPVAVYGAHMDQGRLERLSMLADLRTGMAENPEQFLVYFQPKVDLDTRAITGVEALVRWQHPTLGLVSPDRFIPLLESTGLIQELTRLTLRRAIREVAAWTGEFGSVAVAVNLAARDIEDSRLPALAADALREFDFPAERLILEVTESSMVGDPRRAAAVMQELGSLGIRLSLDDFGTGYSSLSYLQSLPVDEIKIDRSFVLGLTGPDPVASRTLVRSICGLGRNLGLRVVAEGIEDLPTMEELRELGCHIGQGYYMSRPLPAADIQRWMRTWPLEHARTRDASAEFEGSATPPRLALVAENSR